MFGGQQKKEMFGGQQEKAMFGGQQEKICLVVIAKKSFVVQFVLCPAIRLFSLIESVSQLFYDLS